MKLKALAIFPAVVLLTGCSISNQSSAEAQVILGCQSVARAAGADIFETTDIASRHFAEAARIDPGYISLAQAAELLKEDFFEAAAQNLEQEWRMARRLVQGVCVQ